MTSVNSPDLGTLSESGIDASSSAIDLVDTSPQPNGKSSKSALPSMKSMFGKNAGTEAMGNMFKHVTHPGPANSSGETPSILQRGQGMFAAAPSFLSSALTMGKSSEDEVPNSSTLSTADKLKQRQMYLLSQQQQEAQLHTMPWQEAMKKSGGNFGADSTSEFFSLFISDKVERIRFIILIALCVFACYFAGRSMQGAIFVVPVFTAIFLRIFLGVKRYRAREDFFSIKEVERISSRITDHENAFWLNKLIEDVWVVFEPVLCSRLAEAMQPILDKSRPRQLQSMSFTHIRFGKHSPRIDKIKTFIVAPPNEIHMDVFVSFDAPESKILFAARMGVGGLSVDLPLELSRFSFSGKMRIEITLINDIPLIDQVKVSFLDLPVIDFTIRPLKSLDLMDLPGISSWLKGTINTILREMMVEPNQYILPIGEMVAYGDHRPAQTDVPMYRPAVGLLRVDIIEAKDLKATDFGGTSDPYCKIAMENGQVVFKTTVAKRTCSPEWNESFALLVQEPTTDTLVVRLLDHNSLQPDEPMGYCKISVKDVLEQGTFQKAENIYVFDVHSPLQDGKKGTLHIRAHYHGLSDEQTPQPQEGPSYKATLPYAGILTMTIHEADGLPMLDHLTETCDPYCVVRLNDRLKVYKTRRIRLTSHPVWNETQDFLVADCQAATVDLQVKDWNAINANQLIGTLHVQLKDVFADGLYVERRYFTLTSTNNDDEGGVGRVCVSFGIRPLEYQMMKGVTFQHMNKKPSARELARSSSAARLHVYIANIIDLPKNIKQDCFLTLSVWFKDEECYISDEKSVLPFMMNDSPTAPSVWGDQFDVLLPEPQVAAYANDLLIFKLTLRTALGEKQYFIFHCPMQNIVADVSKTFRGTFESIQTDKETSGGVIPKLQTTIYYMEGVSPSTHLAWGRKQKKKAQSAKVSPPYISVHVYSARNLKATDPNGKSDPFFVMSTSSGVVYKSDTKKATLDPNWDESFYLPIRESIADARSTNSSISSLIGEKTLRKKSKGKDTVVALPTDTLHLKVMDYDLMTANDPLGEYHFSITDLISQGFTEGWYDLKKISHGQIHVSFEYTGVTDGEMVNGGRSSSIEPLMPGLTGSTSATEDLARGAGVVAVFPTASPASLLVYDLEIELLSLINLPFTTIATEKHYEVEIKGYNKRLFKSHTYKIEGPSLNFTNEHARLMRLRYDAPIRMEIIARRSVLGMTTAKHPEFFMESTAASVFFTDSVVTESQANGVEMNVEFLPLTPLQSSVSEDGHLSTNATDGIQQEIIPTTRPQLTYRVKLL